MAILPEAVTLAWEARQGPIVLATVDMQGNPNAIYATCVSRFNEDTMVIADNYFYKTKVNILSGSKASLLFITREGKSYQVTGAIEYYTEGVIYDDMKRWNPTNLPGHAAAALKIEHVYSGAEKLV